jgi:hypothetical protein
MIQYFTRKVLNHKEMLFVFSYEVCSSSVLILVDWVKLIGSGDVTSFVAVRPSADLTGFWVYKARSLPTRRL